MPHSKPLSTTARQSHVDRGVDEAQSAACQETTKLGIDVETLATPRLQEDGLKQFEDAFAELLAPWLKLVKQTAD